MSGSSNAPKLSLSAALMDGESAAARRPEAVQSPAVTSLLAGRSLSRGGSLALQRECASCGGQGAGLSDKCPACEKEERLGTSGLQAKLTVNTPGDRYEKEADRVADQIMRVESADPLAPRISRLIQRQEVAEEEEEELQTARLGRADPLQRMEVAEEEEELQAKALQRQADLEEEEELQAKPANAPRAAASRPGFAAALNAEAAGGMSLNPGVRSFFEPRFGRDLSQVRIHAGGRAQALSRQINARAFTHANHIYFGAGQFDPASGQGRRLLAHELTHTVQQGATSKGSAEVQREALADEPPWVRIRMDERRNPNEQEAERAGLRSQRSAGLGDAGEDGPPLGETAPSDGSAWLPANLAADILNPSGGSALPASLRDENEERLGYGLAHVRVHSGERARKLTDQLQARAFTYGEQVWLGEGETVHDRSLIAHELTHVAQQTPRPLPHPGWSAKVPAQARIQAARRMYYALPNLGKGSGGGPGTRTHLHVLDILGKAEERQGEELFSEVQIPEGAESGGTGRADLFKADTRRMIGVQFDASGQPRFLSVHKDTRHNGTKAENKFHVDTAAPAGRARSGADACTRLKLPRGQGICRLNPGTPPKDIGIGDLKPNYLGETLLGTRQVDRYIAAIKNLEDKVNTYSAANPDLVRPKGATWDADPKRLKQLAVPEEFANPTHTSPAVEVVLYVDGKATRIRRMAVPLIEAKGSGIWTYEFIPVDDLKSGSAASPAAGSPTAGSGSLGRGGGGAASVQDSIDKASAALQKVKEPLKDDPKRVDSPRGSRLARQPERRQPVNPLQRGSGGGKRIQRTAQKLAARDDFRFSNWRRDTFTPWQRAAERATGGRGKAALKNPSADAERRLKAEAARQIHARTGQTSVRAPANTAANTRELERVQHWVDHGTKYGRLRQVFGRAFLAFVRTYDRVKLAIEQKVAATRERLGSGTGSGIRGAVVKAVKSLAGTLLGVFIRDVANRLVGALQDGTRTFLQEQLSDQVESLNQRIAKIEALREDLKKSVTEVVESQFGEQLETVQEKLGQVEAAAAAVSSVGRWINLVKWAYRVAQCGAPPLVGCLIALIGSGIAEAIIASIVASCWFQREVLYPVVSRLGPVRRLPGAVAAALADKLRGALPNSIRPIVGKVDQSDLDSKTEDVDCDKEGKYNKLTPEEIEWAEMLSEFDPDHVDALWAAMRHLGISSDDPNPKAKLTREYIESIRQMLAKYSQAEFEEVVRSTPARPPREAETEEFVADLEAMLRSGRRRKTVPPLGVPPEETAAEKEEQSFKPASISEADAAAEGKEVARLLRKLGDTVPQGNLQFQPSEDPKEGDQIFVFVYGRSQDGVPIGGFEHITFGAKNEDGTFNVTLRGGSRYYDINGDPFATIPESRQLATLPDDASQGGDDQ